MRGGGGDASIAREERGRAYLRLRSVEEILEMSKQKRKKLQNLQQVLCNKASAFINDDLARETNHVERKGQT